MRITKKEKVDVKKFMEEIKANRTNRSFTSLESKNRPDSKTDPLRGNLYQSSLQENVYNGFQDSRKSYEQPHNSMRYNYAPYSNPPNEYMMSQPSQNFIISQPSQNFMPNNNYCYPFTFSQSFTPVSSINQMNPNPINPIPHMRPAPINHFPDQSTPIMNTYSNQPERQNNSSLTYENQENFSKIKEKVQPVVLSEIKEVKQIEQTPKSNQEKKKSVIVQSDETTKEKKRGKKKKAKQDANPTTNELSEEKTKEKQPAQDIFKMEKICDDILNDFNSRLEIAIQKSMNPSKMSHFQAKTQSILSALSHFPTQTDELPLDSLFSALKAILIKTQ